MGSPTVGNALLSSVSGWLAFLHEMKFKDKKAGVFGCYGWSGEGNKKLREILTNSGFEVVDEEVKSLYNPTDEIDDQIEALAESLVKA